MRYFQFFDENKNPILGSDGICPIDGRLGYDRILIEAQKQKRLSAKVKNLAYFKVTDKIGAVNWDKPINLTPIL